MAIKEKARQSCGPIPNCVLADTADFSLSDFQNQLRTSRLVRLYAVNAAMAEALAPLVFLEAMR